MKRLLVLALAVAALAAPSPAGAALYWSHDDTVGVANLDGSSLAPSITPRLSRGSSGLAVSSTHLFWSSAATEGTIGRATLDGTSVDEALVSGLQLPWGVAVDGHHVYWADRGANTIGRANLDGSGVRRGFIGGGDEPCGVAVDGSHVYWSNLEGNTIGRANLDGSHVEQDFIVGATRPCGLAVTPTQIYWTTVNWDLFTPSGIGRAPLTGGPAENYLVTDVGEALSLAAGPTHLYWTDEGHRNFQNGGHPEVVLPGAVGRARLDGTEVERRWIPTGIARGVAVDQRVLPGPPPLPATFISYGKVSRERSGAIRLVIRVPGPGELVVNSPQIGWRLDKGDGVARGGLYRWQLRLWPGKGTRAAKRIRHRLRRHGRAQFVLRLSYLQEGHLPLEDSKHLAFTRRAKR